MDLNGKTALITGASRRIGKAMALALADRGADVVVHVRESVDDGRKLVEDIREKGRHCELAVHDLAKSEKTSRWFADIAERSGGIDILVNAASGYQEDTYSNIRHQIFHETMAVSVLSPLAMANVMAQRKAKAVIVNLLDARLFDRNPNHASYHMAKRSLHTVMQDLAVDYAPHIRINAVAPGIILPPEGKDKQWLHKLSHSNPLQSYGTTDDVVQALLYLIQAPFVTGQLIFVDGGRHLIRGKR